MEVVWSAEKHSIGIEAIDAQHRELFAITNGLYQAMALDLPAERQKSLLAHLKRLMAYARFHFATEEELMAGCSFPALQAHADLHDGFKTRIAGMVEQSRDTGNARIDELLDFLVNWIVYHVQDEDRRYARFLEEKGIEPVLHVTPGGQQGDEKPGKDVLSLWQEKHLALEIHELDSQHRELVMILQQANDLLRASGDRQRSFLPGIIRKLFYYSEFHFSYEEEFMSRHGYAAIEEHRGMHAEFIAEVLGFTERFRKNDFSLPGKIVEFLKEWTVNHILVEDRKIKKALPS